VIHLKSVSVRKIPDKDGKDAADWFPFNVPVIRSLETIEFTHPVTFLVGENGSGKSTFLEGIALAAGSITVGSEDAETDRTLSRMRELAKALKLVWTAKRKSGFFLRSEDFFGFVKRLSTMRENLLRELEEVDEEYKDRPSARAFARMPYAGELHAMRERYGDDLDAYSHGESFFKLFKARFVPGGLYLLDEPEAPLSPMRQIIFLSMLAQMVRQESQFIIATHSPILLAYPGATILQFKDGEVSRADYEQLEHVSLTRAFLADPNQFLDRLWADLD
jgi:predicted ATPase